jgi:hypothetical protein
MIQWACSNLCRRCNFWQWDDQAVIACLRLKVANEYLLLDGHKSLFSECGNFIAAILQQWSKNDVKVHYWVENVSSHIVKSNPSLDFKDQFMIYH